MDTRQHILSFIKKHNLAVLSTVGEVAPESSVLEFAETDELEIIVDMFSSSRKFANIQRNPNVSLVIGWDENITVQYEGVASQLSGSALETYQELYVAKIPAAKKWVSTPGIVYFKISPKWIRITDLNKNPWDVQEIRF